MNIVAMLWRMLYVWLLDAPMTRRWSRLAPGRAATPLRPSIAPTTPMIRWRLQGILTGLTLLAMPVIFPAHPRTRRAIAG